MAVWKAASWGMSTRDGSKSGTAILGALQTRAFTAHERWIDDLLSEFSKAEAETLIAHFDGLATRTREGGQRP